MKKFLAVFAVCLAMVTTSMDADAARRFGGGSSFGRSAPTFSQKAPAPAAAPKAPAQQQNAAGQQRQQNAAAPATAAQKPSMMRSILTGMAAALGISALLSMLGINGSGLVSLIMGVILAFAAFFVIRMIFSMMVQKRAQVQQNGASTMARNMPEPESRRAPEPAMPSHSTADVRAGSVMDQFANPQMAAADGVVDVTPADFDKDGFLRVSLENYRKLQSAWDTGNVIELSDFTTPDVFTAITHQLRERGHEVYKSEILELDNKLLGIAQEGNVYLAAVQFVGSIRIADETEAINEVWTLEKPTEGNGGWLLAGIKQVDDQNV